jgi:hypothetical protein
MPLTDGFTFTPVFRGRRVRMRLSAEDDKRIDGRGPGPRGVVTDLDTGKRYRVYGKRCSLPKCYCDAKITRFRAAPGG